MQKICSNELIPFLEDILKRKPKASEMVEILGFSSSQIYYNRLQRNGYFSDDDIKKIEKFYKIDLSKLPSKLRPNAVEIAYLKIKGFDYIVPDKIESIWLDKTLVRDVWCRDEKDLRIVSMPGDSMDGGLTPIRANSQLIVDISVNDIKFSGIFAYTTRDSAFFVNAIELKADGRIKFTSFNPSVSDETYTQDELKQMQFKVIGQVIKNLSL